MKMRIQGNAIRFRLDRKEVVNLSATQAPMQIL